MNTVYARYCICLCVWGVCGVCVSGEGWWSVLTWCGTSSSRPRVLPVAQQAMATMAAVGSTSNTLLRQTHGR